MPALQAALVAASVLLATLPAIRGAYVEFDDQLYLRDHAPAHGLKEGSLHWSLFAKLGRLIDKNGFYGLQTSYSRSITHGGFETTRVTRNGKVYAVENYADAAPLELWTIQRAIEGAAFDIEWQNTTTQPACPAYVSPVPSQ